MKCKVGDRVRFLNDVGGGKVTRIVKNTVYVLDEDDFEIPVMMSDIIVVAESAESGYSNSSRTNDNERIEKRGSSISNTLSAPIDITEANNLAEINFLESDEGLDSEGDSIGIFLAFVPVNQSDIVESKQQLYIINDSSYRVFYSVSQWADQSVTPINAGFVYPDSKELVKTFPRESLNTEITLNVQCLFFKNTAFVPQQPEFYDLRINPTKFFRAGSFSENDFFEEKALIFTIADSQKEELLKTLTNSNIDKVIKDKDLKPNRIEKVKEPEVEEVDLHIHELVENPNDFSPGQIIEMQLARFKVALEGGLKSKLRKMVFIHGVGNGKLKYELLKELDKNYPKLRYQDASFREYGYGATLVFLRTGN
jgi:hypothetical protein